MEAKNPLINIRAARMEASVFGVLAGLGGIVHGIGETLQGNVAPSGIVVDSWTEGPIATNMGGEPGMTLIPNLFATGIATLIVSLAVLVWSAAFVDREKGGLVLLLLSIAMLLVGGGFAPPILGILAGAAGTGINSSYTWWRRHLSSNVRRVLAELWPWAFGICAMSGAFLLVGSLALVYLFGVNNPELFVSNFLFAVLSLLFSIFAGIAYDIENAGGVVVAKG